MAKKSKIVANQRRRELVAHYADRRAELKETLRSLKSTQAAQPFAGRQSGHCGLEGRRVSASVHFRPRQDPFPAGNRTDPAATAPGGHRDQERPRNGTAALPRPSLTLSTPPPSTIR